VPHGAPHSSPLGHCHSSSFPPCHALPSSAPPARHGVLPLLGTVFPAPTLHLELAPRRHPWRCSTASTPASRRALARTPGAHHDHPASRPGLRLLAVHRDGELGPHVHPHAWSASCHGPSSRWTSRNTEPVLEPRLGVVPGTAPRSPRTRVIVNDRSHFPDLCDYNRPQAVGKLQPPCATDREMHVATRPHRNLPASRVPPPMSPLMSS
jgi:hypothetical protein